MGLALLRINKTKEKWRVKISQALAQKHHRLHIPDFKHHKFHLRLKHRIVDWSRRYVMFVLPFITVLREGVEAVVFVGGVSLGLPATAFPLPVVTGVIAGFTVGFLIYRGGNVMSIQIFLIASTCVLYLIASGLFSKALWSLQFHTFANKVGSDVAEEGSGPGSYDIKESVWHVNCCNAEIDNGWDIFNAILGWQNSATYGSVIGYNLYWVMIMVSVACIMYYERTGAFPGKKRVAAVLVKIPFLRKKLEKKPEVSGEQVHEIIRQIHDDARKDTEVIETVTET